MEAQKDISAFNDDELRGAYQEALASSSDTERFRIAEEMESRGLVIPIPDEGGAPAAPDPLSKIKGIKSTSKPPDSPPSDAPASTKAKTETKGAETDKGEKKGKDAEKKGAAKKTVSAVVGFDQQQIVHGMLGRVAEQLGLRYIRSKDLHSAKKALTPGATVAAFFEYDQSDPNIALGCCKDANGRNIPPVLMGRFYKRDVLMAMGAGVADIIKKPLSEDFVKAKLQKLLSRTGAGEELGLGRAIKKIDFSGRNTPDQKAALLVQKVQELMALPHAVTEVIRICNQPDSDMKDLQMPVSSDPALMAMILRRANSAASGSSRKITSILDAVVRIGRKQVKSLALTLSVFNMFSREESTFAFNRQMYWVHSLAAAIFAKKLAERVKGQNPEDAFMAALLHDLGKIIFDDYLNMEYRQVMAQASSKGLRVSAVESEIFAMDHAMLGGRVAENWKLPETISTAIRTHHKVGDLFRPEAWGEGGRPWIPQVVCLANSAVKAMRLGHSGDFFADGIPASAWADFFPKGIPFLGLVGSVLAELQEFAAVLQINLQATFVNVKPDMKDGVARVLQGGLSPLLGFFFAGNGYKVEMVSPETPEPWKGAAFVAVDGRELTEAQREGILFAPRDGGERVLMLLADPLPSPPTGVLAPHPPDDMLQLRCALDG